MTRGATPPRRDRQARRDGGASTPPSASRAWTFATLFGLGLWIAAIVVTGARADPADADATKPAIVIGGAVFFGLVFAAAAIGIARSNRRGATELFERLALAPVPRDAIRTMSRRARWIGYGYVLCGATVTGLMLAAIAVGDQDRARPFFVAMVTVLGLWLVLMVVAVRHLVTMSAEVFAPLGLTLTGLPTVHVSIIADRTWLSGAVSYGGVRHGRNVSITQNGKAAATLIHLGNSESHPDSIPGSPREMAVLTGESMRCWRRVEVALEQDTLLVLRTGGAAASWMLHDLLLAEAIAGPPRADARADAGV